MGRKPHKEKRDDAIAIEKILGKQKTLEQQHKKPAECQKGINEIQGQGEGSISAHLSMKIISSNIRGFGNTSKTLAVKDIIRTEKAGILFLHETKMDANEFEKAKQICWASSKGAIVNARGDSRGLATLWNPYKYQELEKKTISSGLKLF